MKPAIRVRPGYLRAGRHRVPIGRLEERLMFALVARSPAESSTDDLIEVVYGDRADGGPLWARGIIPVMIHTLRGKLSPTGWRILHARDRGYWLEHDA